MSEANVPEGGGPPLQASPLQFRDPEKGAALLRRLSGAVDRATARLGGPVTVMHVCGSHEQAIARYGLRSRLPAGLDLRMGPGCPVCVTDGPEIDAAVALARAGLPVLTYGDMLRVPGTEQSLEDARVGGARVEVIYAATQAVQFARRTDGPVILFATGFETTAVTTAALLLAATPPPDNLFVLSAHKWVPAAMELVAADPRSRVAGYLAAGHAATITGYSLFEGFVARHGRPVVVAGFEPLDILAALALLVERIAQGTAQVDNAFPRCVSRDGNPKALAMLHRVFDMDAGVWRGIARVPGGDLRLRPEFAARDAALCFQELLARAPVPTPRARAQDCICGAIMSGRAEPADCPLFGGACRPEAPVGACMVSTEGACRIHFEHGP